MDEINPGKITEQDGQTSASSSKPMVQRTDQATAAIVDEGLALLKTHGLEQASEFLSSKLVPLHVSRRVLLQPSQRRDADPEKKA